MKVEENMKHYEVMAGADLPEDLKVTVIIDLCTKDLKEHLELSTREMTYKQVRDEIISYVERKRNVFSNDLKAMDLDEVEDDHVWWGGVEHDHEQWDQHCSRGAALQHGLEQGCWQGRLQGLEQGQLQGLPEGTAPKAASTTSKVSARATTAREDPRVTAKEKVARAAALTDIATRAESGAHSQSRCRQKGRLHWRTSGKNGKGNSKGGYEQIAHNVEENKNQLENLEKSGGYRCLCSLEHRGSRCVTSNRFAALQELNEDEEMSVGTGTPPGLTVGHFITVKPKHPEEDQGQEGEPTDMFRRLEQCGGQHREREE